MSGEPVGHEPVDEEKAFNTGFRLGAKHERDACAKAVCGACRDHEEWGVAEPVPNRPGRWRHRSGPCAAWAIHERGEGEGR